MITNNEVLVRYFFRRNDGGIIHKIITKYAILDIGDINITEEYKIEIPRGILCIDLKLLSAERTNVCFVNIGIKGTKAIKETGYDYHSNAVVFEYLKGEWICARFEPRGYKTDLYESAKVDIILSEYFRENGIKYFGPSEYQSENGPQVVVGLCTAYVLQFISEYTKEKARIDNVGNVISIHDINKKLFEKDIIDFIRDELLL